MKKVLVLLASIISSSAYADYDIVVSKRHQTMEVYENGQLLDVWPVSTARRGYETPSGTFYPYSYQTMHYSRKYDNAPMPFSIFFRGGYAIHATPHTQALGTPASHGCVRLSLKNARTLYQITQNVPTTITIR